MRQVRSWAPVFALFLASHVVARELTFEERVRAQEDIERVRFAHLVGRQRSFEQSVPKSVIERAVSETLKGSAALERYWHTTITPEMLHRERVRIERRTAAPDVLHEIYEALGRDSFLIDECVVRPVLVDRLARSFHANDPSLHLQERSQAGAPRARLVAGRIDHPDPVSDSRGRRSVTVDASPAGAATAMPTDSIGVGTIVETREGFDVDAIGAGASRASKSESESILNADWETRWREVSPSLPTRTATDDASTMRVQTSALSENATPIRASAGSSCDPQDLWDSKSLDDFPDPRTRHLAVSTGERVLIWGGMVGGAYVNTGAVYDVATDSWSPMSTDGAPFGRGGAVGVWTGREFIVWGGATTGPATDTGGAYDPVSDRWRPLSRLGAPEARKGAAAVWDGKEMIVWGGRGDHEPQFLASGARYDPSTDGWTPMTTVDAPPGRTEHSAVWTGREMVIWGGIPMSDVPYRYDPIGDVWTRGSSSGAPILRRSHRALWTGTEMVIWGGEEYGGTDRGSGARYDPRTDSWFPMTLVGAPSRRTYHNMIWTGGEVVVWGGIHNDSELRGARYDPRSDRWSSVAVVGEPARRFLESGTWAGGRMVIWGGENRQSGLYDTGGRYDPASDSWTPTALPRGPRGRSHHTAIWTGREMIIWGGHSVDGSYLQSGGRYDPVLDHWTPTSMQDAPEGRALHTAVWTGEEMIVWGGEGATGTVSTGGAYDPIADRWTATPTHDAPTARRGHVAVWSGNEMIVWGGEIEAYPFATNSGSRFDPKSRRWEPMSDTDSPSARNWTTAVWTGTEMIVWGGYLQSYPNWSRTGGRYDPSLDRWTPTTSIGAPGGRYFASAVWTGREMVVFGGIVDSPSGSTRTGGRYDPSLDAWRPTSFEGARSRQGHTAVWTPGGMIVWGGDRQAGARYDPESDSWTSLTLERAPLARYHPTAVWTGREMIVWGGSSLASGGRYVPCVLNREPVAVADVAPIVECTGEGRATVVLDGTGSWDPDSVPGGRDDIVEHAWMEGGAVLGLGATIDVSLPLGEHALTLVVTDIGGATASDTVKVTVRDTQPPAGGILTPRSGACVGPGDLPVEVEDGMTDVCDPDLTRSYDPPPGPTYISHGDHAVTLSAADHSGNSTSTTVEFTIDATAPVVEILEPPPSASVVPSALSLALVFRAHDDDGATGDVVRQIVRIQGCVAYDGIDYGNHDGLLTDEEIHLSGEELCRIARTCGFGSLERPELRVESWDCAGNIGTASRELSGRILLVPGLCGR